MNIGCDIVEIERIRMSIEKFGDKFIKRILTSAEIEIYNNRGCRIEFIAGRFSAKEALSKAFGSGIGKELSFLDIEILPNKLGKPEVILKGEKRDDIALSISHSKHNAMSVCCVKGA